MPEASLPDSWCDLPRSAQLFGAVPEDRSRDDQPLDLPRALIDVADAPVAQPLLQQVLPARAERAEHLDATLRHAARDLTAFRLGDRRLEVVVAIHVCEPSGAQRGERRG